MRWSKEEVDYLKKNYHNTSNEDLSFRLNRSESSILYKANYIMLHKSKEYISNLASEKNKLLARDLSMYKLREIAKTFKTKSLFRLNDYSAYITAIKLGCIDDICSHMITKKYSTPQLICKYIFDNIFGEKCEYNTRKIIKPYELDLYYPNQKIAIEYNGKYWHKNNDKTELKIEMCKKLGIELIIIKERTRKYNIDIKEDVIKLLPMLKKITNKIIEKQQILNIEIDNSIYDEILDDVYLSSMPKKYKNISEFKRNNNKLYNKLNRISQLHRLGFNNNKLFHKNSL